MDVAISWVVMVVYAFGLNLLIARFELPNQYYLLSAVGGLAGGMIVKALWPGYRLW